MYNDEMSIEHLLNIVRDKLSSAPSIGAKIKFDLGDDGIIFIDGTQTPPALGQEDADCDTTFECSAETFEKILNGQQDPTMAFMMGKLKIKGSMGYALKLNSILGD